MKSINYGTTLYSIILINPTPLPIFIIVPSGIQNGKTVKLPMLDETGLEQLVFPAKTKPT